MAQNQEIAIIGSGPAGLMAAEILSAKGFRVSIFERKPSAGRKFLMAGRGGLNLTHSEDLESFIQKYGGRSHILGDIVRSFTPQDLKSWCEGLGQKTFIGSSGRVFPESFKASPLLRAWIGRLESQGVQFYFHHDWQGWQDGALAFKVPDGGASMHAAATLLALGGASWPRLGSDGSWVDILKPEGVDIAPLQPSNCGFRVSWSDVFRQKFAGQPVKPVIASFQNSQIQGEIIITENGIEGGAVYALSSGLRERINQHGAAELRLDLKPGMDLKTMEERLRNRRRDSLTNYLRKTLNLSGPAIGLLMESPDRKELGDYPAQKLAQLIKDYPLVLSAPFPTARAISTAGGVAFETLDRNFMIPGKPGVFVAGEMLDWEAPTGGYLLQATMATAVHAAHGMASWLGRQSHGVVK